ncbi:hypothetical protein RND71_039848 [Anisodus tanguticus]|uniref:Uncharacterized protein n=1 Tax=Anisodus tanguticus TaxID=243964 RepID=A0AAE1USD0_9SOLA|nr:hypothetical protein RND71_039848 [Anisodus tanguticus]
MNEQIGITRKVKKRLKFKVDREDYILSWHLKFKHCKHCSKKLEVVSEKKPSDSYVSSTQVAEKSSKVIEKMDDLGPMGPGHSPGMGHSIHN